jgi:hypothetical protein
MHSKDFRRLAPSAGASLRLPLAASTLASSVTAAVALVVVAPGCDGPSAPVTMKGEPVCADFELGASRTKMQGGLKQPVRMRVLEDGDPIATVTVTGLRTAQSQRTRFLLPDSNAEYEVEWAQCANQRGTSPVGNDAAKKPGPAIADSRYECGEAKVYATEKLVTKRGEGQSRSVTMPPPPNPACWEDEVPPSSASAAPSAPPPPVEPAPSPDPSVAPSASGSASAAGSANAAAPTVSAAPSATP